MNVTAIKLVRETRNGRSMAVVYAETHGIWVEVIAEPCDANFSHIAEIGAIRAAAADAVAEADLRESGGIVGAP